MINSRTWQTFLIGLILVAGCRGNPGLALLSVGGAVTFGGAPVPAGSVLFQPDESQGNHGPSASAEIKNGKYQISREFGVVGGHYIITIAGFDGVADTKNKLDGSSLGKSLFPSFVVKKEIPKTNGQKLDLEVPKAP